MELSKEKIDDLIQRIVETAHPLRIILFGSFARGEARPHSDVDVMVVMPNDAHRRKTAQSIYSALWGIDMDIDIVVATESDLDKYRDSPGLIYREALRDGKELYVA
jgi:uncharacterized protein